MSEYLERSRRYTIREVAVLLPAGCTAFFTGHTTMAFILLAWAQLALALHYGRIRRAS